MKYLQYFKIFEKFIEKTLYHGGLEGFYDEETGENFFKKFKTFAPRTAYFSDNPKFAADYADRKSSEGGYDADRLLYTCKFKGNLFEYDNPEDMNKLIPLIPDEVDVSHGTMWFMTRKVSKEEMIKALQGIAIIKPRKEFAEANIGDEIPDPMYPVEKFIVVNKDDKYVWTISKVTYNYYLSSSKKGYDKHFSEHASLRHIFEKWRNAIIDAYNESTGSNKKYPNSKYAYGDDETSDFYRIMITYLQAAAKPDLKTYDFNYGSKGMLQLKQEQVDNINKIWAECIKEFDAEVKEILYKKKWNIHTEEVLMTDNWTFYENDVIQHLIEKLGYDGYKALEDGHRTYAIYHPDKTIEITNLIRI